MRKKGKKLIPDKEMAKECAEDREKALQESCTIFCTEYDPRMCDEVLILMGEGMCREEVARKLKIPYGVLLRWEKEYPNFRDALYNGHYYSMAWWAEQGRTNLVNYTGEKFNVALYTFMMKNRFGFTDAQKVAESENIVMQEAEEKNEEKSDKKSRKLGRERETAEIISILKQANALESCSKAE